MKKLLIAFAIACLAGASQSASLKWGTGTKVIAPDTKIQAAAGTLSMYVWLVDKATYESAGVDTLWASYGSTFNTATGSVTGGAGKTGVTVTTDGLSYSADETTYYYALALITYDPGKDGTADYYIANKAVGKVNTAGSGTSVSSLATNLGGDGDAVSWTAVPEPTSGLLMLLGMAGLAIRRKRA